MTERNIFPKRVFDESIIVEFEISSNFSHVYASIVKRIEFSFSDDEFFQFELMLQKYSHLLKRKALLEIGSKIDRQCHQKFETLAGSIKFNDTYKAFIFPIINGIHKGYMINDINNKHGIEVNSKIQIKM